MKNTALGFIITYPELLYLAKQLSSNVQFGRPLLQSAFVIGGIYIIMCLILSGIAKWLEKRMSRSPKLRGPGTTVVPIDFGGAPGGSSLAVVDDPRMRQGETLTEVIATQQEEKKHRH